MTPEEKNLLERTHKLAEENNAMITKIYRSIQVGRYVKIAYWVIIIGLSYGAFFVIKPYFDMVSGVASTTVGQNSQFFEQLKEFMSAYGQ